MLRGQGIVCFAKEWGEDPTSNNHVMRLLARDNTVLWLNSIGTRRPSLGRSEDLAKIRRKLRTLGRGTQEVAPGLHVFTPLVLPLPASRLAAVANLAVLRTTLAALRRRLVIGRFQLWSFLPTAAPYVGKLGEDLSIYYCVDEWSQFRSVHGAKVARQEEDLLRKVDVVFATSQALLERKRPFNPETHLLSHGVDHEHFSAALRPETPLARELVGVKRPIIGFFGLLEDWIDVELLAHVARSRADWTVCVIGRALVDVSPLRSLGNVLLLGRRPYAELPSYCRGFDVGLCPFRVNELTMHVNPIKLREYLAAGLPVVSTDLPECRLHPQWTRVGCDPEDFVAQIESALRQDSPEARRLRSEAMKAESWDRKIEQLGMVVNRRLQQRRRNLPDTPP